MDVRAGKKAECWRIDAFELWCWRRLLKLPWTVRRSNQSILKEINPEYSLEGLMLKLKLQYFGYLMWRIDSLEKTLMLGKIEGRRRRGRHNVIYSFYYVEDKGINWNSCLSFIVLLSPVGICHYANAPALKFLFIFFTMINLPLIYVHIILYFWWVWDP